MSTPFSPSALPPTGEPVSTADLVTVHGTDVPPKVLADIDAALIEGMPAICAALQIDCDFPVMVEVFPDQGAFDRDVMNADMRGYYAISGEGRIQMVSPANSGRSDLAYEDGVAVAVHESVHLALDRIDPELPDWLEEGTAVYLGPHGAYEQACREQLRDVPLPTFADLRDHYADMPAPDLFAYTLVASIANNHGLDSLNVLLRASEAMETALGQPIGGVESDWRAFVAGGCVAEGD